MRGRAWAAAIVLVGCHAGSGASFPVDAHVETVGKVPSLVVEAEPTEAETPIRAEAFAEDALLPCTNKADTDAARHTLSMLSTRIDALDDGPGAKTKPVLDALRALLLTPCLELAAADLPDELEFDSGLALKTWWNEEGGFDALYDYLPGKTQLDAVVTPAAPRRSFFLEGNEAHPLAPLLCSSTDTRCGRGETAAWYRRATTELERRAPNRDEELAKCTDEAKAEEPTSRWATYRSCRLVRTPHRATLPLGRFRAPSDGLFVIAHRGHGSCGTFTAYDLANGTAINTRCNGTPIETGRVSLSALREAVWMIALSALATDGFRPQASVPIPIEITPGRPRDAFTAGGLGLSGIYSTSYRREWTWLRPSKGVLTGQVSGEIMHGGPSYDANDNASTLLGLVEASYVPGCAPGLVSSAVDWTRPGRRAYHPDDDPPFDFDQPDHATARQQLAAAKMPSICAGIP